MGRKIAIACEDPTYDQYIARPVVEAALAELKKPNARVQVVRDPHTSGYTDLIAKACDILDRYGGVSDAVIFIVDLDCEDGFGGRADKALRMANAVSQCPEFADKAVIVGAKQEIEIWALWGERNRLADRWSDALQHCDPKDAYFDGLVTKEDNLLPDGGRTRLVKSSLQAGWGSLAGGCPELA